MLEILKYYGRDVNILEMFDKFKDDSDGTLALLSGASASSLELITGTVSAVAGISADNDDERTSFGEAIATRLIGGWNETFGF